MSASTCLAIDLGASSGRVIAGWLNGNGRMEIAEVHRFENIPLEQDGQLVWNFDGLMSEIETGLDAGIEEAKAAGRPVVSIGIDSWGVDFGLLDEHKNLLGPVVHYRDSRTDGVMEEVTAKLGREVIFKEAGIQFLPFNTIYQLAALKTRQPELLRKARHFLMISDLVAWRLTGRITCEYTNATTTQLYDSRAGQWSKRLLGDLGLPETIFPPVVQPGEVIGKLTGQWAQENITVYAVATHDTGSAVAGVPADSRSFAYISCGTWSLLGTELPNAITSAAALEANFTNEGGAFGTVRLLKNIMGLWVLQECRREWVRQGKEYGWSELETMAREATAGVIINVDDPRLLPPGNMPGRIVEICREMQVPPPESDGAMVRCILESLAARYRDILHQTEAFSGHTFAELHMVGGGIRNTLLCELTARAIGRPVIAGPAEATAAGNLGLQMIAQGHFTGLADMRACIAKSFELQRYLP